MCITWSLDLDTKVGPQSFHSVWRRECSTLFGQLMCIAWSLDLDAKLVHKVFTVCGSVNISYLGNSLFLRFNNV